MKELEDKLSAEHKETIEASLKELKEAHAAKDFARMEAASAALQTAWQNASAELYQQQGPEGAPTGDPQAESSSNGQAEETEVTDVEYEEVDDK